MGVRAQKAGSVQTAVEHYKEALHYDRKEAWLFYLANAQQDLGQSAVTKDLLHDAMDTYREVIEMNPEHHHAWYNLGYIQEGCRQYEDALESFAKSLELNPADNDCLVNLGNTYMSLASREKEREEEFERAGKRSQALAFADKAKDNFTQAAQMYSRSIEIDSKCAMSYYNLASAQHCLENLEQAKELFAKSINLRPRKEDDCFDPSDAYFNLGLCTQEQAEQASAADAPSLFQEAIQHYQEAMKLNPMVMTPLCSDAIAICHSMAAEDKRPEAGPEGSVYSWSVAA